MVIAQMPLPSNLFTSHPRILGPQGLKRSRQPRSKPLRLPVRQRPSIASAPIVLPPHATCLRTLFLGPVPHPNSRSEAPDSSLPLEIARTPTPKLLCGTHPRLLHPTWQAIRPLMATLPIPMCRCPDRNRWLGSHQLHQQSDDRQPLAQPVCHRARNHTRQPLNGLNRQGSGSMNMRRRAPAHLSRLIGQAATGRPRSTVCWATARRTRLRGLQLPTLTLDMIILPTTTAAHPTDSQAVLPAKTDL